MIEIWHPNMRRGRESQSAYDDIYSGAGIRLLDSFYLWLLSLLKPRSGARLLDVSSGEGALVHFALRRRLDAWGVDFSTGAVRRARREHGTRFAAADGGCLPFGDASFDFVTCIGSLEHFIEPERGMREIARVLTPEGRSCILLPNTFSLLGNVNYARRTGEVWDDGQPIQRYHTRAGWARMLSDNGLAVERVVKYELPWPRTARDGLWYLRRPFKLAHLLVGMLMPANLANCLVYLCRRRP